MYQLQKWNVLKYNTGKARRNQDHDLVEKSPSRTSSTTSMPSHTAEAPYYTEIREQSKRRRSWQSVRSSASTCSTNRPPPPKKHRSNRELPRSDLLVEHLKNIGPKITVSMPHEQDSSSIGATACEIDQTTASISDSASTAAIGDPGKSLTDAQHMELLIPVPIRFEGSSSLASTTVDTVISNQRDKANKPSTFLHQAGPSNTNPSLSVTEGSKDLTSPFVLLKCTSIEEFSQLCKTMVANPPLNTWSPTDVVSAELAGCYWEAVGRKDEAFPLYTLLLQDLKSGRNMTNYHSTLVFCHALIKYARCVSSPAQCEMIQYHLRAQEDHLMKDQNGSFLDQFMILMALAETCSRVSDMDGTKLYLLRARDLIKHFNCLEDLFQYLHHDYEGLYLMLYLQLRRACDPEEDLLPGAALDDASALWKRRAFQLELWMLDKSPGPFELYSAPIMQNSCVLSCLEWCHQSLPKGKLREGYAENWFALYTDFPELDPHVRRTYLFKGFWDIWRHEEQQRHRKHQRRPRFFVDLWKSEGRSRTGLSPTEILAIICVQIDMARDSNDESAGISEQMAGPPASAIAHLLMCTHSQIARAFLDAFLVYRSIGHGTISRVPVMNPREPSSCTSQLDIFAARMSTTQTLASSLHSSNKSLVTFRKVQASAREKIAQLKKKPSNSSLSQPQSGSQRSISRWSFWSISQLSEDVERISL